MMTTFKHRSIFYAMPLLALALLAVLLLATFQAGDARARDKDPQGQNQNSQGPNQTVTESDCKTSLGLGRVAWDNGACVILDTIIVEATATGESAVNAAATQVNNRSGWLVENKYPLFGVLVATHSPDTLSLAGLKTEMSAIAAFTGVAFVEADAVATAAGAGVGNFGTGSTPTNPSSQTTSAPTSQATSAPTSQTTSAPASESTSAPTSVSVPAYVPASALFTPAANVGQGPARIVQLPAAANNIQVTRSDNALSVSWQHCDVTQVSCNGGSPVTGYLINLRSGDGVWGRVKTLADYTSGSAVNITGGVTNAAYKVSVGVQNGNSINWMSVSAPALPSNVSNLDSDSASRGSSIGVRRWAAAFTTGGNPGGYTLKGVTATLRAMNPNGDLRLAVHKAKGDNPSPASKTTLQGTNPSGGAGWTDVAYACEGDGCALSPNTTYYVIASASGSGYEWRNAYSGEQTTFPTGEDWTIGWGYYSDDGGATWDTWQDWQMFSVEFEQRPSRAALTASGVTDSTATLTLARYPGAWWLRSETTDYTCKAATDFTEDLTGLSRGESYTYKAYGDPNCVKEIAGLRFTTLPSSLAASGIGINSATLTIGDHAGRWYVKQTGPGPGAGTCSSAVSGDTHTLANLTPGAPYTIMAYSDASCSRLIAMETFDTTLYGYGPMYR